MKTWEKEEFLDTVKDKLDTGETFESIQEVLDTVRTDKDDTPTEQQMRNWIKTSDDLHNRLKKRKESNSIADKLRRYEVIEERHKELQNEMDELLQEINEYWTRKFSAN